MSPDGTEPARTATNEAPASAPVSDKTADGRRAGDRPMRGIALMLLATMIFPFVPGSAKVLGADFAATQVVWARYLGQLLFMLILFLPTRGIGLFRTRTLGFQVLRSLLLLGSTLFMFSAVRHIPLATAMSINFTGPFFVIAFSLPILGERISLGRWVAVIIGFMGALIIIRPGPEFHWAGLLVLGCAACYALYQVLTRKLAHREDSAVMTVYTALVGTIVMSATLPFEFAAPSQPAHWLWFAIVGVASGTAHLIVVIAFRYAPATAITPMQYLQLIGAAIIGYFLFGDVPDAITWLGAAVIIASGISVAVQERRAAKRRAGG